MFIAQAFVHGANKKHNVILIVPDFAACAVHLHLEGDDAKPANMVKDQRVRDLIQNDLDYASKSMKRYRTLDGWRWPRFCSQHVCSYTVPKVFGLIAEDFTVENGLLTPKMSMKRSVVEKRHADVLEALHAEYSTK